MNRVERTVISPILRRIREVHGHAWWELKRQTGSHRTLAREGWQNFVFAFHDGEEIGPRMLARIAKHTGLTPEDL